MIVLVGCHVPPLRGFAEPAPRPVRTATPNVIFITATPEGYGPSSTPGPQPTPTVTSNVVYVTATPQGGEPTSTPYVIFVTATPLVVGPYHPTQGAGVPTIAPTLDLSGVTIVPAVNATAAPPSATPSETPVPQQPTATSTPLPPTAIPAPATGALYADRLGMNFISSAQHQGSAQRIQQGLDSGVGWDRFAIYWNEIEQQAGQYVWQAYDDPVRNDVANGLKIDAILLGTPQMYAGPNYTPTRLYEPVFTDGSDTPGPGKDINPGNPWAAFVYNAVQRYKPNGVLANAENWPSGAGVRVWEIWNEPDFTQFWKGGAGDYARLLKVAYIAAQQADSKSKIMMGGLVLFEQPQFLIDVLNAYRDDPNPINQRFPFDIVAVHAYGHPPYTFTLVAQTQTLLAAYGLGNVPVWVNESGVPVWNDYPGPTWATRPDQIVWRATLDEQAAYVIDNAVFTFLADAAKLFHFQLYDDCGNQPRGTTFAPNDGSLCDTGAICWGDALGLLRNTTDNVCFNQSPKAGKSRPAFRAFHTVGEVFGTVPFVPLTGYSLNGRQWTIFARPSTAEIITVVWDETGQPGEVVIPPRAQQATLIQWDGSRQTITPGDDGAYHVQLDPATNRNQTPGSAFAFMIGGRPAILIEQSNRAVVSVLPLLDASRSAALVKWRSSDLSLTRYEVYYHDDTTGGDWLLWQTTDQPGQSLFTGQIGHRYSFFARGQHPDGMWTQDSPFSQAWTTLQ